MKRFCTIIVCFSTVLVGCSFGSAPIGGATFDAHRPVPAAAFDHLMSAGVASEEIAHLSRSLRGLPTSLQWSVANSSSRGLSIVVYDTLSKKTFSNNVGLRDSIVESPRAGRSSNVYVDSSGRMFAMPIQEARPVFAPTAPRIKPLYVVGNNPGNGPYRRVFSNPGYSAEYALLALPCQFGAFFNSDQGYVYEGGWSNGGSAVDSGFQASFTAVYKPFMLIDGRGFNVNTAAQAYATGSGPSSLSWPCGENVYLQFSTGSDATPPGIIFVQISSSTDFSCPGCPINGIIFLVDFPNGYQDWGATPNCNACIMKRNTTIAQVPPENLSDGSYFGTISWSNTYIYPSYPYYDGKNHSWGSINAVGGCQNYPAWTTNPAPTDGCQSSPSGASIQVGYAGADNESDFISANGNNIQSLPSPSPNPTSSPSPSPRPSFSPSPLPSHGPHCTPTSCGGNSPVKPTPTPH